MKNIIYLFCIMFLGVSYAQDTTSTRNNQRTTRDIHQTNPVPYDLMEQTSYVFDNQEFYFTPVDQGVVISRIIDGDETPFGTLRRTTDDGFYIMTSEVNSDVSFGRFDHEGNFRSYRYDREMDEIVEEEYTINPAITREGQNENPNSRINNK